MPDITGSWGRENDPIPISEEESRKYRKECARKKRIYDKKVKDFFKINKINEFTLKELNLDLVLNTGISSSYLGYHTRNSLYVIADINPKNYKLSLSYHSDNLEVLESTLKLKNLLKQRRVSYNKGNVKKLKKELEQRKQKESNLIQKLSDSLT